MSQINEVPRDTVVEIPGFVPGDQIGVKMRRPNIMYMLRAGKIPNEHISTVVSMFGGKPNKPEKNENKDLLSEANNRFELHRFYAEICLVEPTYKELEPYLTDEQMLAIFEWATTEAKQLNSFRDVEKDGKNNSNGKALPKKAK
jgi:hypothetical protein